MAVNSYFPATYQPIGYQAYPMQPNALQTQPNNYPTQPSVGTSQSGINWVQGKAGAKAYPLAPGTNALLMDAEAECFYIKSTDMSGMPMPLRVFEYKEVFPVTETIDAQQSHDEPPIDTSIFATKEDLEEIKRMLAEMTTQRKKGEKDGK